MSSENFKGDYMGFLVQIGNGLAFGTGLILAASIMEKLFHMGFCH